MWRALVGTLDADGDMCVGTGEAATSAAGADPVAQVHYYLDRPRAAGDLHGQASVLWSASALMR